MHTLLAIHTRLCTCGWLHTHVHTCVHTHAPPTASYTHMYTHKAGHTHAHTWKARVSARGGLGCPGWGQQGGASPQAVTLDRSREASRGLRRYLYVPHKKVSQVPSCPGTVGLPWAGLGLRVTTGCPVHVLGPPQRASVASTQPCPVPPTARGAEPGTVGVEAEGGGSAASQARAGRMKLALGEPRGHPDQQAAWHLPTFP